VPEERSKGKGQKSFLRKRKWKGALDAEKDGFCAKKTRAGKKTGEKDTYGVALKAFEGSGRKKPRVLSRGRSHKKSRTNNA